MDDLHDALGQMNGKRPAKRLITAISYKNGFSQTELDDGFNTRHRKIYSWLARLNPGDPLWEAVTDTKQSRRNYKLLGIKLNEFRQALHGTPLDAGYDESA